MKTHHIIKSWNTNFRTFLLATALGFSFLGFAQNKIIKTIDTKGIKAIIVNGDQIFNIKVETAPGSDIVVTSITDGEYENDYQVITEVTNGQLTLALKRTSIETIPDDKRNAHKVIAAILELIIPENFNISIKSDVGSVVADGKFKGLNINLSQGGCKIDAIAQVATIKTTNGHIDVLTQGAIISTDSKSGLVDFPSDMMGFNLWKLSTVSGNITVKKQD